MHALVETLKASWFVVPMFGAVLMAVVFAVLTQRGTSLARRQFVAIAMFAATAFAAAAVAPEPLDLFLIGQGLVAVGLALSRLRTFERS